MDALCTFHVHLSSELPHYPEPLGPL